jgi:hypothetical protein
MRNERGSIALFVLFVCLGVAALVQTISVIAMCADRAILAEDSGRARMEEKDEGLAVLRRNASRVWAPMSWTVVRPGPGEVEGSLVELPDSQGWQFAASTRQGPDLSRITVSARLERGRDGLDLPLAALVAADVTAAPDRSSPWLEAGAPTEGGGPTGGAAANRPLGYLATRPEPLMVGPGVITETLISPWKLDAGWLAFFRAEALERANESGATRRSSPTDGLAAGPRVYVVDGEGRATVPLPDGWGLSADSPDLVIVSGGASLECRYRGDLYGVIVVNEGGAALEGTRVHGAVFVTGRVDFGNSGGLVFSLPILRWATDRSLVRTRLLPGSRWERVE